MTPILADRLPSDTMVGHSEGIGTAVRVILAVASTAAVIALGGCASGPQYSDLARPATADDAPPGGTPPLVVKDSTRLAADDDGTLIWVGESADEADSYCLVVGTADKADTAACGGLELILSSPDFGSYALIWDGAGDALPGTAVALSHNVYRLAG